MAGPDTGPPPPESDPERTSAELASTEPIGLTKEATRTILRALEQRNDVEVEALVKRLHVADQADLLEMVSPEKRKILVDILGNYIHAYQNQTGLRGRSRPVSAS